MNTANSSAMTSTGGTIRRQGISRPWNWCTAASTSAKVPDSSVLASTMLAQSGATPRSVYRM